MLNRAILQFGTGRFLLAHVDLFVSEALAAGQAAGGILVVQTTRSPARGWLTEDDPERGPDRRAPCSCRAASA